MSAIGPKRTFLVASHMSAFGGKADMALHCEMSAVTLHTSRRTSPSSAVLRGDSGIRSPMRQIIIERADKLRLPAIYQWPEVAEEGGFIGYGPRIVQLYRDIFGRQLVQLLLGAKAADLPVEQPTKFELVINLRTAKAIGVEVPAALDATRRSAGRVRQRCTGLGVRYWPKADMPKNAIEVAIGGKADIGECTAHVCF